MLPGQKAEDFTARAGAIAEHLGVTNVKVVKLEAPTDSTGAVDISDRNQLIDYSKYDYYHYISAHQ